MCDAHVYVVEYRVMTWGPETATTYVADVSESGARQQFFEDVVPEIDGDLIDGSVDVSRLR